MTTQTNPLAALLDRMDAIATAEPHPAFRIGHEFSYVTDAPWTDAEGGKHRHEFTLHARVTEHTANGCKWETVQVVHEHDAPPAPVRRSAPTGGSMVWAAVADGCVDGSITW